MDSLLEEKGADEQQGSRQNEHVRRQEEEASHLVPGVEGDSEKDEGVEISSSSGDEDCEYGDSTNCCSHTEHQSAFVANRNRKEYPELPDTVSVLEIVKESDDSVEPGDADPESEDLLDAGGKVYLVGTAHFSKESQADVRKTISETQPDIVMVELCQSRINVLNMDEETLLNEAKNLTKENVWHTIRQSGFIQGIMHVLLLSMSAHITKQLGMAPGGEFRAAFQEAKNVPGCKFYLGDRPIQITLQRALASLNFWQKLRKDEVERCKQSDLLEELLREMAGEFPALSKIFVSERDQFMAESLRCLLHRASVLKSRHFKGKESYYEPVVIVAVVGIGHKPGIEAQWNKSVDMKDLLRLPEKSKGNVILRYGVAGAVFGAAAYVLFRGIKWSIGY